MDRKAKKKVHYGLSTDDFLYLPDSMNAIKKLIPQQAILMVERAFQPLMVDDDFGVEPIQKNILPSYYYDVGQETRSKKRKFYTFGKSFKEKR